MRHWCIVNGISAMKSVNVIGTAGAVWTISAMMITTMSRRILFMTVFETFEKNKGAN